jgi:GDP/GTP exchange factor required for growth at low temperature
MHFLPPAMFNKTPTSRPTTISTSRKLRKTRSIPDMSSNGEGDMPAGIAGPTFSVTGRGHSQSVTAVDIPRYTATFNVIPPGLRKDSFAEVMDWHTPSSTISSQFSAFSFSHEQTQDDQNRPTVLHPFGPGITFNSPSSKSTIDRLPAPRHLREMQSFESGMTARQIDMRSSLPSSDSPVPSEPTISDSRPPSAMSLTLTSLSDDDPTVFDVSETHVDINANIAPSAGTQRLTSAHTIEVFNVLQTYRGLPCFENLVPDFEGVIKLSLAADQSGAPRDDPRFVIWGEVQPEHDTDDYHSTYRDSLTDFSASNPSSSVSSRKSIKASKMKTLEAPSVRLPLTEFEGQRVLLAATIERWIAQLTSTLDYDELLNFFLTYRNYVSAVDVCNFLICRFHWALQKPPSMQDEAVRRVVRVRTFVAIRYWLLTFFTVDFIPNRELRLLFADWLNTLIHDPLLKTHSDGIVSHFSTTDDKNINVYLI